MLKKLILFSALSLSVFSFSANARVFSRSSCCCQNEEPQQEERVKPVYTEKREEIREQEIQKCAGRISPTGECIEETERVSQPVYTEKREEIREQEIQKCAGRISPTGECIEETKPEVVVEKPVYTDKREEVKNTTNYHRGLW